MQNHRCFEAVHKNIYTLENSGPNTSPPFASIPVVMCSNWAQTPPVVEHGNRPIIVQASLKLSFFLQHVNLFFLKTNMCLTLNPEGQSFSYWPAGLPYNFSLRGHISLPEYLPSTNAKSAFLEKLSF